MAPVSNPISVVRPPARAIVSDLIRTAPADHAFDARAVLQAHPSLAGDKSAVLELVCEEISRRITRGEHIDSASFADQFPEFRSAVIDHVEVYRVLAKSLDSIEPRWPAAGETHLGYELCEEIGRGAFSRVFLSREYDVGNRSVVVKLCPVAGGEAEILGKLEHEAIVPVYSVRTDRRDGLGIVVMPWRGRATLRDVLDFCFARRSMTAEGCSKAVEFFNQSLPAPPSDRSEAEPCRRGTYTDIVLALMTDVCRALRHAHQRGVVHADVKPSNMLVSQNLRATLLDFNLSKELSGGGRCTGGTVTHMAPELLEDFAAGNVIDPTAVSDVYSFGTTLCECFELSGPYGSIPTHLTPRELARWCYERHQQGLVRSPSTEPGIARLIRRCIATDPQSRPQSMSTVAELLAAEQTFLRKLRRQVRSHRRLSSAAVAVMLAATAGQVVYLVARPPKHELLISSAQELVRDGALLRAIEMYELAEESLPASVPASERAALQMERGLVRLDARQFDEAYVDFRSASTADGQNPAPPAWAGFALAAGTTEERGTAPPGASDADIEVALDHFRCATQLLQASSPELQFNTACCCFLKRDDEAAAAALAPLVGPESRMAAAFHLRGMLELQRAAAERDYLPDPAWIKRAAELEPTHVQYTFDASCTYARIAQLTASSERQAAIDQCLEHWRQAVSCGASSDDALQLATWCDGLAGDKRFEMITADASAESAPRFQFRFLEPLPR